MRPSDPSWYQSVTVDPSAPVYAWPASQALAAVGARMIDTAVVASNAAIGKARLRERKLNIESFLLGMIGPSSDRACGSDVRLPHIAAIVRASVRMTREK